MQLCHVFRSVICGDVDGRPAGVLAWPGCDLWPVWAGHLGDSRPGPWSRRQQGVPDGSDVGVQTERTITHLPRCGACSASSKWEFFMMPLCSSWRRGSVVRTSPFNPPRSCHHRHQFRLLRHSQLDVLEIAKVNVSEMTFLAVYSLVVRTSVFGRQTLPALHPICGWQLTTLRLKCPPWASQLGQLSLPSLQGR